MIIAGDSCRVLPTLGIRPTDDLSRVEKEIIMTRIVVLSMIAMLLAATPMDHRRAERQVPRRQTTCVTLSYLDGSVDNMSWMSREAQAWPPSPAFVEEARAAIRSSAWNRIEHGQATSELLLAAEDIRIVQPSAVSGTEGWPPWWPKRRPKNPGSGSVSGWDCTGGSKVFDSDGKLTGCMASKYAGCMYCTGR